MARRFAPWIFVALAIPVALAGLQESNQPACDELRGAFSPGVTTEQTETLSVLASKCETNRRADGATAERTIVNWAGMVAAVALLTGAWVAGATLTGGVSRQSGLAGIVLATVLILAALAAFFI